MMYSVRENGLNNPANGTDAGFSVGMGWLESDKHLAALVLSGGLRGKLAQTGVFFNRIRQTWIGVMKKTV
ncbi:hypothetical protein [Neisseria weaveri]|uniref:hypothetical protein n=1 Tax=Neisseria weaveri TaxID=28091 RepID=UPI0005673F23|nr:hypothetical protein [Neisseria weaveri]